MLFLAEQVNFVVVIDIFLDALGAHSSKLRFTQQMYISTFTVLPLLRLSLILGEHCVLGLRHCSLPALTLVF